MNSRDDCFVSTRFTEEHHDDKMILEQRLILNEIQTQQSLKNDNADHVEINRLRDSRFYSQGYYHFDDAERNRDADRPESKLDLKCLDVNSYGQDVVSVLPNGQQLRLKGTSHTYKAIENGTASLAQCFSCCALLQVPQGTKALYCPFCHDITPIVIAQSSISQSYDNHVASVVQQQELEVAHARKMAKLSET
jgi:LSD1 subclass zinc finger protein